MRKALSVAVAVSTLLLVGSCGSTASGGSQTRSDRILDHYKGPDSEEVYIYCHGDDLMIYMDGNKSGSLQMIPNEPRCV